MTVTPIDLGSAHLHATKSGGVLKVVIDRPERRNALSAALCADLVTALEQAAPDPGVGAILIAAEGPVFCAGMDLDEALSPAAPDLTAIHERLFSIGAALPKPFIAAVQGSATLIGIRRRATM